jgi:hypothetical protein
MTLIDYSKPFQCFNAYALLCSFKVLPAFKAYKLLMFVWYTTQEMSHKGYEQKFNQRGQDKIGVNLKTIEL